MSKTRQAFSKAWDDLIRRHATGKPEPQSKPETLPLKSIKRRPDVFQHRRIREYFSEGHVRALETAARGRASKALDPVTVWWDGKAWVCIDGHHRLDAYRRINHDAHAVPVQVFSGSPDQALAHAAEGNTKAKLPMTQAERSDTAWRLTATTGLSKPQLADAAGVSEALIAGMRRTLAKLESRGVAGITDMSWPQARMAAAGKDAHSTTYDEDWIEKEAAKIAVALGKALGERAGKNPELLARALEIYNAQLPGALAVQWVDRLGRDTLAEVLSET